MNELANNFLFKLLYVKLTFTLPLLLLLAPFGAVLPCALRKIHIIEPICE